MEISGAYPKERNSNESSKTIQEDNRKYVLLNRKGQMIVEHTTNKRKSYQIEAPHYKNLERLYWTNYLQFSREMVLSVLSKHPTQSVGKQCRLESLRPNSELIN